MISLLRRVQWWLQGSRKEAQLREELQFHLAKEAEERLAAGLQAEDARSAAQRDLGNEARVREDVRAVWTWRPLDELAQDVRYALRTMATHRAVTIFAALSLALGIGANTAIYSFMEAVLLRTLPVPDPDSLVVMTWRARPFTFSKSGEFVLTSISGRTYRTGDGSVEARIFPYPAFELLRDTSDPFLSSVFTVFRGGRMNVLIDGQAELTDAQYVSGGFFPGLAIPPGAGRLFVADDDRPGAEPVAVISAGYAARRFGSVGNAVGKPIRINNAPFTIVGVTPEGFEGVEPGAAKSLYVPMRKIGVITNNDGPSFSDPNYYWAEIMGRLRPGVTREQANAALGAAFAQWVAGTARNDIERANLPVLTVGDGGGGLDTLRRRYEKPLLLLQAIVAVILLIACANTANLLLARSAARQREIAVRLSIGAGRFRLIRQLLTESLVLAVLSGTGGILLAIAGTRLLSALLARGDEGLLLQASVNWTVLLVTLSLSLLCGLIFGLAPAVQSTRPELVPALKDTGAHFAGTLSRYRLPRLKLQHGLVVAQIALLMLLLVGAGLFARTLANLQSVPLGFNPENVLLFDINAPQAGYPEAGAAAYYTQLRERFVELPGVRAATLSHASMIKAGRGHPIRLDGVPLEGTYRLMQAGPRFFSTMQIPLLAGREFDERDLGAAVAPGVVSDLFARTYFPDQNPVGRRLTIGGGMPMEVEVIGVSAPAHYGPVKFASPPVLYLSYAQAPPSSLQSMTYALRTDGDPMNYVPAVRQVVHNADSRIPVTNFKSQAGEIASTINQEILLARICVAFAIVALVIACAGLYGTLAYTVARRTKEIGIRIAIGARRGTVIWMVMREVCVLAALGLLISLPMARALSKFVQSFLFEMTPNDPRAIAIAVTTLVLAALAAAYGPARRASTINPTTALRQD
jgi:macrolide transport system ATP-binding/permease protein